MEMRCNDRMVRYDTSSSGGPRNSKLGVTMLKKIFSSKILYPHVFAALLRMDLKLIDFIIFLKIVNVYMKTKASKLSAIEI